MTMQVQSNLTRGSASRPIPIAITGTWLNYFASIAPYIHPSKSYAIQIISEGNLLFYYGRQGAGDSTADKLQPGASFSQYVDILRDALWLRSPGGADTVDVTLYELI